VSSVARRLRDPVGQPRWQRSQPAIPDQLTSVRNPNYEQFGGRTVPFLGDYIWVSSLGDTSFGVWTDYRNTVAGVDAS
jgi:hypothetical protein